MKYKIQALLFISFLCTTGCKETFSDREIKGNLVVDKAQYGNDKLEFYDPTSKIYRFIYPGRKIIEINQGLRKMTFKLMESGRAQLVKMEVAMKDIKISGETFFIDGTKMDQTFDIKGERVGQIMQVEYLKTSKSINCHVQGQVGLSGEVWLVRDTRYDYVIHFQNPSTKKDIATFTATGEVRTEAKTINLGKECRILRSTYLPIVGDI